MQQFVILVAIVSAIWLLIWWLIRRGRAEYRLQATALEDIAALSFEEAESRALALLSDENLFRCVEASSKESDLLAPLADGLRRLFERFACVESVRGSRARLARNLIGTSSVQSAFLRIGRGMEGTDSEFEIGVRTKQESIYELYPNESPDPTFGTYRSVYHWILATASEGAEAKKA